MKITTMAKTTAGFGANFSENVSYDNGKTWESQWSVSVTSSDYKHTTYASHHDINQAFIIALAKLVKLF